MIHCEGNEYIVDWKDDLANGIGEYTNVDGMKYYGEWVDDKQCGNGT